MVIGAFPVMKLGVLAVRQIAKPIAEVIKARAKTHPLFRNYICMPPAQLYNWIEVKTKMWALNLGRPVHVPPLTEAMAIDLGANLLGEFIIFFIGSAAIILEYNRQSKKDAKKEERIRLEKEELIHRLAELSFRVEHQDAQLREMARAFSDLESRSLFRWTQERLREYQPFDPNTPDQTPAISSAPQKLGIFRQALDLLVGGGGNSPARIEHINSSTSGRREQSTLDRQSLEADDTTSHRKMSTMDEYDPIRLESQRKGQEERNPSQK